MIIVRVTDPDTGYIKAITGFVDRRDAEEYKDEARDAGLVIEIFEREEAI